jgi:hypothetical protein
MLEADVSRQGGASIPLIGEGRVDAQSHGCSSSADFRVLVAHGPRSIAQARSGREVAASGVRVAGSVPTYSVEFLTNRGSRPLQPTHFDREASKQLPSSGLNRPHGRIVIGFDDAPPPRDGCRWPVGVREIPAPTIRSAGKRANSPGTHAHSPTRRDPRTRDQNEGLGDPRAAGGLSSPPRSARQPRNGAEAVLGGAAGHRGLDPGRSSRCPNAIARADRTDTPTSRAAHQRS